MYSLTIVNKVSLVAQPSAVVQQLRSLGRRPACAGAWVHRFGRFRGLEFIELQGFSVESFAGLGS